jgi:hypothetical protein
MLVEHQFEVHRAAPGATDGVRGHAGGVPIFERPTISIILKRSSGAHNRCRAARLPKRERAAEHARLAGGNTSDGDPHLDSILDVVRAMPVDAGISAARRSNATYAAILGLRPRYPSPGGLHGLVDGSSWRSLSPPATQPSAISGRQLEYGSRIPRRRGCGWHFAAAELATSPGLRRTRRWARRLSARRRPLLAEAIWRKDDMTKPTGSAS